MSNVLKYEGYYESSSENKQEIIFIVNQCRTVRVDNDNINLASPYNDTTDPRTMNFHYARRMNSNK